MTKQQKITRHISFRYLRHLKYYNAFDIANAVIRELWLNDLISSNTKHLLLIWLYA